MLEPVVRSSAMGQSAGKHSLALPDPADLLVEARKAVKPETDNEDRVVLALSHAP